MNQEQEYNYYAKKHSNYEIKAFSILFKELKKLFKNIPIQSLNFDDNNNYYIVYLNINQKELEKSLFKVHYAIGIDNGNDTAKRLRKENPVELKDWNPLPFFNAEFQSFLLNYYRVYGGEKIRLLSETMAQTVVNEIKLGTLKMETVEQMRDRIHKAVKDPKFYKWQALRIARTETTFAMNAANEVAGEVSGVMLEKVWITRLDGKERPSHRAADGQKVDQKELFNVGFSKMKFPGDGSNGASAEELVNCRCTYSYKAKRDENGRLIFTDF